jgi:PAS domain S-box-containing protein
VETVGSSKSKSLTTEALRVVFDAAPDAMIVVDQEGCIRALNARVEELFGYDPQELLEHEVEMLVPIEQRDEHRQIRATYTEAPTPRPIGVGLEIRGRHKSGAMIPVDISLSPVGETLIIAAVRDVTERNRLREWGVSALRAAEEERERIALELHDDMAQRLAALMVRLRLARLAPETEERT